MSRIGKNKIIIPAKTEVKVEGNTVSVKGPLGELSRTFRPDIKIEVKDGQVSFVPVAKNPDVTINSLWGTVSAHVKNMILGVNKAYEKKLIVEGIGFKAEVVGANLVFKLGFSHPITVAIPKNLKVTSEKTSSPFRGLTRSLSADTWPSFGR